MKVFFDLRIRNRVTSSISKGRLKDFGVLIRDMSVLLNNFSRLIRQVFQTEFVTLTNDVAVPSAVVNQKSEDVTFDTA